jgi:hypothetical protein
LSGGRAFRIAVAACRGGAAYAVLSGGDILRLGEVALPECPGDPGVALAALVEALVEAARLRAACVEVTAPASIAVLVDRELAGLPPGRGPRAEAWGAYRDIVFAVLEKFETWEFREGSDLDPTYAALEGLCERAVARAGPPGERSGAAALICTRGTALEIQAPRVPGGTPGPAPQFPRRDLYSPEPAGAETGGALRASPGEEVGL